MTKLVLIRHGQSTWNADNKFTGWVDAPLSKLGREEARKAAEKLRAYPIDVCFTSQLIRAIETGIICLTEYEEVHFPMLQKSYDSLGVRFVGCPHCQQQHDRDINAAINIRNEGLRLLVLGTSTAAQGGDVRLKTSGRKKSTKSEALPHELGSLHRTARSM